MLSDGNRFCYKFKAAIKIKIGSFAKFSRYAQIVKTKLYKKKKSISPALHDTCSASVWRAIGRSKD